MSQSRIEGLRASHRKSGVKLGERRTTQEILPNTEPLVRPTRDTSIDNRTNSLNYGRPDTFSYERRIQQLQRELQDYEFEHQANMVYNRQFKILGKLFGEQQMEFDQIRQHIEDLILNSNSINAKIYSHHISNQQYPIKYSSLQEFSHEIHSLSQKQLSERLFASSRSEFMEIMGLGSLENHGIWHNVFDIIQELHLEVEKVKYKGQGTTGFETGRSQTVISQQFEEQLLQKNKYIEQLAEELERINTILLQKNKKLRQIGDENSYLQEQLDQVKKQNSSYLEEIAHLKDSIEELHQQIQKGQRNHKGQSRDLEMLKQQLKEVRINKEKQCNQMIMRVDEVMRSLDKYKQDMHELQTDNNSLHRQIWTYKSTIEQLQDSKTRVQKSYEEIKLMVSQKQDQISALTEKIGLKQKEIVQIQQAQRKMHEEEVRRMQERHRQTVIILQQDLKQANEAVLKNQKAIEQKYGQLRHYRQQIEAVNNEKDILQGKMKRLQEQVRQLKKQGQKDINKSWSEEDRNISKSLSDELQQVQNNNNDRQMLEQKVQQLNNEILKLKKIIQEKDQQLAMLRKQIQQLLDNKQSVSRQLSVLARQFSMYKANVQSQSTDINRLEADYKNITIKYQLKIQQLQHQLQSKCQQLQSKYQQIHRNQQSHHQKVEQIHTKHKRQKAAIEKQYQNLLQELSAKNYKQLQQKITFYENQYEKKIQNIRKQYEQSIQSERNKYQLNGTKQDLLKQERQKYQTMLKTQQEKYMQQLQTIRVDQKNKYEKIYHQKQINILQQMKYIDEKHLENKQKLDQYKQTVKKWQDKIHALMETQLTRQQKLNIQPLSEAWDQNSHLIITQVLLKKDTLINSLKSSHAQSQQRITQLTRKNQQLQESLSDISSSLQSLEQQKSQLMDRNSILEEEKTQLMRTVTNLQKQVLISKDQLNQVVSTSQSSISRVLRMKQVGEEIRRELKTIQEVLESYSDISMQQNEDNGRSMMSINENMRKNTLNSKSELSEGQNYNVHRRQLSRQSLNIQSQSQNGIQRMNTDVNHQERNGTSRSGNSVTLVESSINHRVQKNGKYAGEVIQVEKDHNIQEKQLIRPANYKKQENNSQLRYSSSQISNHNIHSTQHNAEDHTHHTQTHIQNTQTHIHNTQTHIHNTQIFQKSINNSSIQANRMSLNQHAKEEQGYNFKVKPSIKRHSDKYAHILNQSSERQGSDHTIISRFNDSKGVTQSDDRVTDTLRNRINQTDAIVHKNQTASNIHQSQQSHNSRKNIKESQRRSIKKTESLQQKGSDHQSDILQTKIINNKAESENENGVIHSAGDVQRKDEIGQSEQKKQNNEGSGFTSFFNSYSRYYHQKSPIIAQHPQQHGGSISQQTINADIPSQQAIHEPQYNNNTQSYNILSINSAHNSHVSIIKNSTNMRASSINGGRNESLGQIREEDFQQTTTINRTNVNQQKQKDEISQNRDLESEHDQTRKHINISSYNSKGQEQPQDQTSIHEEQLFLNNHQQHANSNQKKQELNKQQQNQVSKEEISENSSSNHRQDEEKRSKSQQNYQQKKQQTQNEQKIVPRIIEAESQNILTINHYNTSNKNQTQSIQPSETSRGQISINLVGQSNNSIQHTGIPFTNDLPHKNAQSIIKMSQSQKKRSLQKSQQNERENNESGDREDDEDNDQNNKEDVQVPHKNVFQTFAPSYFQQQHRHEKGFQKQSLIIQLDNINQERAHLTHQQYRQYNPTQVNNQHFMTIPPQNQANLFRKNTNPVPNSHIFNNSQNRNTLAQNITIKISPNSSHRSTSPISPNKALYSIKKIPLVNSVPMGSSSPSSTTIKHQPKGHLYMGNNNNTTSKFPAPQSIYTSIPMTQIQRVKSTGDLNQLKHRIITNSMINGQNHILQRSIERNGNTKIVEKQISEKGRNQRSVHKGRIEVTQKYQQTNPQMKFNRAIASPTFAVDQHKKQTTNVQNKYSSRPITHLHPSHLQTSNVNLNESKASNQSRESFRNQTDINRQTNYGNMEQTAVVTYGSHRNKNIKNINKQRERKIEQQKIVFNNTQSSKHLIIDGLSQSNESGIEIHQKDLLGECCNDC